MRTGWTAPARLRLLAALAIMLFAVLPHATLAASTIHVAAIPTAMPGHHDASSAASDAVPCHDEGEPTPAATHAMPPCCILGCGMLATVPQPQAAPRIAVWLALPIDGVQTGVGALVEPAERPPRPLTSDVS